LRPFMHTIPRVKLVMKTIFLALTILCSGCALYIRQLDCQIRVPIKQGLDASVHVSIDTSLSGGRSEPIVYCRSETNGSYLVYNFAPLVFIDLRRVIYVEPGAGPAQYFVLDAPIIPMSSDWSPWCGPDYSGSPYESFGGHYFYWHSKTNAFKSYNNLEMRYRVIKYVDARALNGCTSLFEQTTDGFLNQRVNKYVLEKGDEKSLDGPYKIVERVTSDSMIVEKNGHTIKIHLRGCIGLGGDYENRVKHSYYEDLGLYLLKNSVENVSSNEIKAVVYGPANRVYVGGSNGFSNLTYVMPQLLHIAYGELRVNHSDTNFPLYKVFVEGENLAKKRKNGYWATHTEP